MCGIAGFSTHEYPNLSKEHLLAMGNAIRHRGPDANGEYLDEHIGLCHRRLSILDLSESGNQPMFSQDEQCVIVFNGEIYNFPELRTELEAQGSSFVSSTDTEVILHLYQKMGIKCLEKLNGMFAFALWDKQAQSLFIARDRIGKKPLYFLSYENRFAFASEIKSLLCLPDVPKEIRSDAVYDFFAYQYIPDPKSIFKHIHKLRPGHFLLYKAGEISIEQYWDVDFSAQSNQSEAEFKTQLQDLAQACTKRRMLSDVPLGAFLSGGVDSSGVVAMMAKEMQNQQHSSDTNRKNEKDRVTTCTIAFDDDKFNEAEFAQSVANQYNTDHHEFMVSQNVSDTLEDIVAFFDEPFADPSLVPTFYVSELARQAVTVAIAGDGGDEVFAGYQKYNTDDIENRLREKFPLWMRTHVFPSLTKIFSRFENRVLRKAHSLFSSLSVSPAMGFYLTNSQIKDHQWQNLVKPEFADALGAYHPSENTLRAYESAKGKDHLSRILYTDMKTYLPGGILVKVDRMSMANSLEVRAPLLDKEMIEFAATMPSELKFKDGEKKYLLKEAFKHLLPDDILYRKKMGFSVPLASWFRAELKGLAERYLVNTPKGLTQFFKQAEIERLWQQHQSNQADHSNLLWSMLMFELWWQRYMLNDQHDSYAQKGEVSA
ncbi:asparagine synthase (glutamine-hydrolyzing) [Ningiella sp. W23]|uniref:asparagine synthase (glutamine-hydrolyzing) n=1 Tax=Ningiella sp. W23 TaxID=3023715 RepID=UPI0037573680